MQIRAVDGASADARRSCWRPAAQPSSTPRSERSGYFPVAANRLWHSGVHLRAALGAPVRAPIRGSASWPCGGPSPAPPPLPSSSSGTKSTSSTVRSLSIPCWRTWTCRPATPPKPTPSRGCSRSRTCGTRGRVGFDAGKVVPSIKGWRPASWWGMSGTVSRGPEEGPEVHFEIFTTEKLTGDLRHAFHYINATDDGAIVRTSRSDHARRRERRSGARRQRGRAILSGPATSIAGRRSGASRFVTATSGETEDTEASFVELRELSALTAAERSRLYRIAIAPYVFWTDELSEALGLPANQTIYSYNALTFLFELSARTNHVVIADRARHRSQ